MAKLEELVASYGKHNADAKELKKVCDTENAEIKKLMVSDNLTNFSANGYTVKYSVSKQESLNEDKVLDILKRDWEIRGNGAECPYIKTKEYIDMDMLESVLYKGEIPQDVMAELNTCRITKEIPKLTVVKDKDK